MEARCPLSYASARTALRAEKPLHRGLSLCYMTPVLEMEAICQLESWPSLGCGIEPHRSYTQHLAWD